METFSLEVDIQRWAKIVFQTTFLLWESEVSYTTYKNMLYINQVMVHLKMNSYYLKLLFNSQ